MRRKALRFLAWFCFIYGVLVVPWPFVQSAYSRGFVALANATYSRLFRGGTVEFERLDEPRDSYDLSLFMKSERTGQWQRALISSRQPVFYQTLLLVALVAATPWRSRRWLVLLLGLGAMHVVIFAQFFVMLASGFARPEIGLIELSATWQAVLNAANRIVLRDIVAMLMIPVFVWMGLLLVFGCAWFEVGDGASDAARPTVGRRRRAPKLLRRIRRRSQVWP